MPGAFIGLGANLGSRRDTLLRAWRRLAREEGVDDPRLSEPYETEPIGMTTPFRFINAVGRIETSLAAPDLLGTLLRIEAEFGRDRAGTRDRPLDLDLLYYGDLVISTPSLTVPHPEMADRLFVMAPLAELAPDFVHPVRGETSTVILARLKAGGQVVRKVGWYK